MEIVDCLNIEYNFLIRGFWAYKNFYFSISKENKSVISLRHSGNCSFKIILDWQKKLSSEVASEFGLGWTNTRLKVRSVLKLGAGLSAYGQKNCEAYNPKFNKKCQSAMETKGNFSKYFYIAEESLKWCLGPRKKTCTWCMTFCKVIVKILSPMKNLIRNRFGRTNFKKMPSKFLSQN